MRRARSDAPYLRKDSFDGLGFFDAGEADVQALEFYAEAFVIDAEEVEHGGMEVGYFDWIFDGVVAEFVGGAVGGPALDAAAGQPN